MKKHLKKLVSFMLVLVMVLTVFTIVPFTASAAGNSFSSATNISFGVTYTGTITQSNNYSYYKFTLPSSGKIHLDATTVFSGSGYIYIYNANQDYVWSNYDDVISEDIHLVSGTYYLCVNSYYTGNYNFKLTFTSAGESFTESQTKNDNSFAKANSISLGTKYFGQIAENDDDDYYKFTLTTSGKLHIDATADFSGSLYIYNASQDSVWNNYNDVINEDIHLISGTYYLSVFSNNVGNYNFKFTFTSAGESFAENQTQNNDTFAKANSISLGTKYYGQIAKNEYDDYYKFTLTTSGKLHIDAKTDFSGSLYIYNAKQDSVWSNNNDVINEDIHLISGTYYLRAYSYYSGNYNFKLTFTSAGESFTESQTQNNDTFAKANSISLGTKYYGQIAKNETYDYYKFTLSSSEKIHIYAKTYFSGSIYIYNSNQNYVWSSYEDLVDEDVKLDSGTYYLCVYSYESGNYNFTLSKYLPAPTSVKLNRGTLGLGVGKSYDLVKTVSPSNANQNVTWSSSNTSVATVSSTGKVTAKKVGTATITVKTSNNKTASCSIAVTTNEYPTVNAHATNGGAQITWGKITGVPKYRVYKKVNGSWQKVGDSTGSSYIDKSAKAGNTYAYTVRGITSDAKQFMSDYNKNGKTLRFLSTPQISKMEIVSGGVKLTWNKLSGAGKYRVYYKSNGTGSWHNLGDVTSNTASFNCYGSGNKFTYTIRAISADGKQFYSGYNTSGKTIKYVYDPKITSISNTSKGVKIAYTKPTGTEKFRIYRKTQGGSWGKIADTTATSYTDGSAKNGTRYYYTVRCISSTGKSFQSYYDTAGKSIVCKK